MQVLEIFTNLTFCLRDGVSCFAVPTSLEGELSGTENFYGCVCFTLLVTFITA